MFLLPVPENAWIVVRIENLKLILSKELVSICNTNKEDNNTSQYCLMLNKLIETILVARLYII